MTETSQLSDKAKAFSVDYLLGKRKQSQTEVSVPISSKIVRKNPFPKDQIRVDLVGRDLWLQFHKLGTEMIITKAGRRMFPSLKINVKGLQDHLYYLIYVDIDPVGDRRYRYVYQSSKWAIAGPGDLPQPNRRYVHGEGPQLGKHWNFQSCVAFDKLKLTNSRKPQSLSLIPLHSMHKYQPKIYIQPIAEELMMDEKWRSHVDPQKSFCFTFEETQFITVTAYQNQQITRLKIASNPFAKGFRESCRDNSRNCNSSVSVQPDFAVPNTPRRLVLPGPVHGIPVAAYWNTPCQVKLPINYWLPTYPFLAASTAKPVSGFSEDCSSSTCSN